jgi:hypothetical protein
VNEQGGKAHFHSTSAPTQQLIEYAAPELHSLDTLQRASNQQLKQDAMRSGKRLTAAATRPNLLTPKNPMNIKPVRNSK